MYLLWPTLRIYRAPFSNNFPFLHLILFHSWQLECQRVCDLSIFSSEAALFPGILALARHLHLKNGFTVTQYAL